MVTVIQWVQCSFRRQMLCDKPDLSDHLLLSSEHCIKLQTRIILTKPNSLDSILVHTLHRCSLLCFFYRACCSLLCFFYRAWNIGKKGELSEAGAREKAHKDRVTAILWHKNFLYSLSYDGCVKMWDATNLELVMEVRAAHEGQRIQCGAIGPDGFLYTGGDDKVLSYDLSHESFGVCCQYYTDYHIMYFGQYDIV